MPTELSAQYICGKFIPFSEEDRETAASYHNNQVVRLKVQGVRKPRSLQQLRLYWAACQVVADNLEDIQWNTKSKVDFQCRVATHFVDPNLVVVRPDGTVQFAYRSIAFSNLSHISACNYFNRAFEVMAAKLNTSVDKLLENSQ